MATVRELQPRIEALKRRGLVAHLVYRRMEPPRYLKLALESDVHVMSHRGVHVDATLCVVKLAWLEQLIEAASKATNQEKEINNDSSND